MVNYLAVLVAGILSMALGFVWFGPLFGKAWMKSMGMSEKQMAEAKAKGPGSMKQMYFYEFLLGLLTAWVLAVFISATTFGFLARGGAMAGAMTGFWAWLGFFVPTGLGSMMWEKKPKQQAMISMGYNLVRLVLVGALLAAWV